MYRIWRGHAIVSLQVEVTGHRCVGRPTLSVSGRRAASRCTAAVNKPPTITELILGRSQTPLVDVCTDPSQGAGHQRYPCQLHHAILNAQRYLVSRSQFATMPHDSKGDMSRNDKHGESETSGVGASHEKISVSQESTAAEQDVRPPSPAVHKDETDGSNESVVGALPNMVEGNSQPPHAGDIPVDDRNKKNLWITNNISPEEGDDADDNISIKSADLKWTPPPEQKRFNLCFAGCGFLGIYHLGVASVLMRNGREFLSRVEKFGGASAGVLVASVLSVRGVDEEALQGGIDFCTEAARSVHKRKLGLMTPGFSVLEDLEVFLRKVLPPDAHKIASGRLHVSMTQLGRKQKNILQSDFEEYDDLIQCLLASSYVPFVTGKKQIVWRGKKYIDGGMTENLPRLPGARTVLVSPFSGGADIAPRDRSIKGMVCRIHGQDFTVHPNNLLRGLHAFFPPKLEYLNMYFDKGVRDATYFLKQEGMYEGPKGNRGDKQNGNSGAGEVKKDSCDGDTSKVHSVNEDDHVVHSHIADLNPAESGLLDVSITSVDSSASVQYETCV